MLQRAFGDFHVSSSRRRLRLSPSMKIIRALREWLRRKLIKSPLSAAPLLVCVRTWLEHARKKQKDPQNCGQCIWTFSTAAQCEAWFMRPRIGSENHKSRLMQFMIVAELTQIFRWCVQAIASFVVDLSSRARAFHLVALNTFGMFCNGLLCNSLVNWERSEGVFWRAECGKLECHCWLVYLSLPTTTTQIYWQQYLECLAQSKDKSLIQIWLRRA